MNTSSLIPLAKRLTAVVLDSLKQAGTPQVAHPVAASAAAQTDSMSITSTAHAITTLQIWFQRQQAATALQALDGLIQHPEDQACQQQFAAEIVRLASADPTMVLTLQGWAERVAHTQSTDGWCTEAELSPCL